ncbi:MAG: YigZ family protein [Clostridia bacterium]|nr:YigZ family protein [Clostridia bacterium]
MADYFTVEKESEFTLTEKKSRFIGYIKPCESETQAVEFINLIKKKHSDAKHNVYAYVLRENNKQRYSDDGEPQGTAGLPVLEVLTKRGITDVCVVVTRYFGGILLGTGGLTRAYSAAGKGAVENSGVKLMTECNRVELSCDYSFYNTLQSIFKDFTCKAEKVEFLEKVEILLFIKSCEYKKFETEILDKFSGQILLKVVGEQYFGFEIKNIKGF